MILLVSLMLFLCPIVRTNIGAGMTPIVELEEPLGSIFVNEMVECLASRHSCLYITPGIPWAPIRPDSSNDGFRVLARTYVSEVLRDLGAIHFLC